MTNREVKAFSAPEDGVLTSTMLETFQEDGVIVLRDYVAPSATESIRDRMLELVDEFDAGSVKSIFSATKQTQLNDDYFYESGDKIRFFFEYDAFDESGELRQAKSDSLNKMGHAMHDLDPVFEKFSRTPKLAATVASLGYADPGLIQSMYIFKPPGIGGEVHFHQDSTFIYTEPESCMGFWFAIDDATVENGCMYFIPGAHKLPLKQRNYRKADGDFIIETIDDTPWPVDQAAPAEAKAGTMVIFDGRMPHMSNANTSDKSRHAYTLHVIDKACHYPADNWLQRSESLPLRGFK